MLIGLTWFFETLQTLYKFFSGSVVHDLFLKKRRELPTAQLIELKRLSDTRWACQYDAICAVKKTLPAIIATLRDTVRDKNVKRRTESKSVSSLVDEQFVLHLIIFEDVFRTTKFMSDTLQSPNFDLLTADDLAQSVITAISEKRTDDKWDVIRKQAGDLCVNTGIATVQRKKRQTQTAKHLEDFIVEAPIERPGMGSMDDLKTQSFYPVLDRLLIELRRRFSIEANDVLAGFAAGGNRLSTIFLIMCCAASLRSESRKSRWLRHVSKSTSWLETGSLPEKGLSLALLLKGVSLPRTICSTTTFFTSGGLS